MSEETTFIFRSKVEPGSRFWEGLRLSAAFVGMDHIPLIVFMDDAVPGSETQRPTPQAALGLPEDDL